MKTAIARSIAAGMIVGALLLAGLPAEAARRVALVIGNDTYATLPTLNNAATDARGIARKLKGLGFEVILKIDASRRHIGRAVVEFENKLGKAEVGLVFYAGHGIQAGGENYIIPSNAEIEVEDDLSFEGIKASTFLHAMKRAGSRLNIVIMDACRDNPLPKRSRSATRGLTITAVPAGIMGTA
ncbi:MAG: caspase family protein, partial [Rhodospirillaceae bacterium]|nr:caspase family protein [Rhodospirillaceae bacterium]